jgi:superfamily II DNA or RNA helicase/diadenosine tetraphosphate (Ap4A) HIT family hydrolase
MTSCPFCEVDTDRIFYESHLILGLWDAFPVAPGHALLVTRRHVASWFDASPGERAELLEGIVAARQAIEKHHTPDGYNIGVNVGEAAGQTVPHLHVHVIPRTTGDVPDPRGGVRCVIPGKANYLAHDIGLTGLRNGLVRGEDDPLLPHLVRHLATAEAADLAVSFISLSGILCMEEHLRDLLRRGGRLRMVTGDYLDITDPNALLALLDLADEGHTDFRVFETGLPRDAPPTAQATQGLPFHPKAYICRLPGGQQGVALVGSANLSASALTRGVEWSYRIVSSNDGVGFREIGAAFEHLLTHPAVKPLTVEWVENYRRRRSWSQQLAAMPAPGTSPVPVSEEALEELPLPEPNRVQQEALLALEATRAAGNSAGLVVLATGLGKTWLSAFDTNRPEFKRVLFVAHREEILAQAIKTFRRIRSSAHLGHYMGQTREPDADIVFASIQTLGRQAHLQLFARDSFDYIIVDEFHHASAATYRGLIAHFIPKFLLGLTATPERTDGGDLLALCGENLVYRCDVDRGIRLGLLCPFHYFGVPDEVDYANIPWRNSRFDEEALTTALATKARAQNALEQWRLRAGPGTRTIAFCASQRHADFMARFFTDAGVRAVAVHSGPTSAARAASLEKLAAGELDVICAVDIFNEGVDLPTLDTVLMLRPTESRIVFLQQFGRGLRVAPGKERLTVVDYIGNHRAFLLKPQTLFNLGPGRHEVANLLDMYEKKTLELPPGCEVTYELKALELLRRLLPPPGQRDALQRYYEDFVELHGVRPTALEAFHDGYNPRSVRASHGSWLAFVAAAHGLSATQEAALNATRAWFEALETTPLTRSYKMLVLLAMLNADQFPGGIDIDTLADGVRMIAGRSAHLQREFGRALSDSTELRTLLEKNPIEAWTGGAGTSGVSYFAYRNGRFSTAFGVQPEHRHAIQELTRELADWRLAEYLQRARNAQEGALLCRVSQANGRPMLFLPDRSTNPDIPEGWTDIRIEGETFQANFVKVALNVVRRPGQETNELPKILRGWFGPDAGQPGTSHQVSLERRRTDWYLFPVGRREGVLRLWQSYSREQIPPLFGMEFSQAIWNVGYVRRSGHIFLLVTLDKEGHASAFQYRDKFLGPDLFQWQSQNRTRRDSADGQEIREHRQKNVPVHLFVRAQKKRAGQSGAAPFIYCGDVEFVDWEGDAPITVRWRLSEPVPRRLQQELAVPNSP